ncbi:hypothetical protein [Flavobacterium macacae]|nr:hypothetical protein [Flavobacterium macacae]
MLKKFLYSQEIAIVYAILDAIPDLPLSDDKPVRMIIEERL